MSLILIIIEGEYMTNYEDKYKAFCIDDRMKMEFSDYSVGVEMCNLLEITKTETIMIEFENEKIIHKENIRA